MAEPITGLFWGIKRTWVDYVARMKDGRVDVSDGARALASGEFFFPLAEEDATRAQFHGGVHFTGHYGMLAVSFVDPAVEIRDGETVLTIRDDDEQDGRLIVVQFDPQDAAESSALARPRLTAAGADLFFDNYRPGTRFDAARTAPIDDTEMPQREEVGAR